MEVDYSPFLHALKDGRIWWSLIDAVKLGAGFRPVPGGTGDTSSILQAPSQRAAADARNLLADFGPSHYTTSHPRVRRRDDTRYVEAHEFLIWIRQCWAPQSQFAICFPSELARAVDQVEGRAEEGSPPASGFESLTLALKDWFDKALAELPDGVRARVEEEFLPLPWDDLTPDQRRSGTLQRDYQNDPATREERQYWWDFYVREDALKQQVEQWTATTATTTADLAIKEARLQKLDSELKKLEQEAHRKHRIQTAYYPRAPEHGAHVRVRDINSTIPFVPYPRAMRQLADRLQATPEELAAWIWWGPEMGGIAAYMNANELDPPPRFSFPIGTDDFEYLPYIMGCWFREEDIQQFSPIERYITGQALLDRWRAWPDLHAAAYIRAKIFESRLMEMHPLFGFTQGTAPDDKRLPPMTIGLFALSEVKRIEDEDFPARSVRTEPLTGSDRDPSRGSVAPRSSRSDVGQEGSSRPDPERVKARNVATQRLHESWQLAYRKSKKAHPDKSDIWHSMQIAKLPVAKGRSAETIRRKMKP